MRKLNVSSFVRGVLVDQRGQVLPWVAFSLIAMLGVTGLALDLGHAYIVRSQLQNAVNSAALAGVSGIASSTVASVVTTYEGLNNNPNWGTVTSPAPTVKCVNLMMPVGQSCTGSGILNAVQVEESVKMPTFFMSLFGVKTLTVNATATASPAEARPWIVEIVLDTTPSMVDSDSNCTGASTAEQCALIGIQGLLSKSNPCPTGASSCNATNANMRIGLMTFPNIQTSQAASNYSCSGTVNFMPYSTPVIPAPGSTASYTPITYTNATIQWSNGKPTTSNLTLTYQSTYGATDPDTNGFYTNYYSSTDTSGLNPQSTLVKAIGRKADSVSPCLQVPASPYPPDMNGGGTAFAPILYAAQTALQAEQALYPKVNGLPTRTAIIFLSDGQANALSTMFPPAGTTVTSNGVNVSGKSVMNDVLGAGTAKSPYVPAGVTGTYPSGFQACQQAVQAAQYASTQGTRVYSVAYGSENGGCLFYTNGTSGTAGAGDGTDVNPLMSLGTLSYPFGSITGVVPCSTIRDMASNMEYFYSDANEEKTGTGINGVDAACTSPDQSTLTNLNDIFQGIYGSLTAARLIPNSAT